MSIPHKYGTTIITSENYDKRNVSIPHKYGTTTVFKPFLTASFYKLSKITRFFSQKSVNLFFYYTQKARKIKHFQK